MTASSAAWPSSASSPSAPAPKFSRISCYTDFVKRNVTVALDEETARWARVEAAKQDISVSTLLARLLRDQMGRAERYEESMERFLSPSPTKRKWGSAQYPSREGVHDRADLR